MHATFMEQGVTLLLIAWLGLPLADTRVGARFLGDVDSLFFCPVIPPSTLIDPRQTASQTNENSATPWVTSTLSSCLQ